MTVKELIAHLQELPQDLPIYTWDREECVEVTWLPETQEEYRSPVRQILIHPKSVLI